MKTVVLTALIALAAATVGHAQQGAPDGEWPTYGGDAGSTKYSPLDQIDANNVEQLQVVWRWTSPDGPVVSANDLAAAAFKATPVMVEGVLYVRTSLSIVAAIDAATGDQL